MKNKNSNVSFRSISVNAIDCKNKNIFKCQKSSEWHLKYANESSIFLRLICWMGFLVDSDKTLRRRIIFRCFLSTLVLAVVDNIVLSFFQNRRGYYMRLALIYISTYMTAIAIWYLMRRKREDLSAFLRFLHEIHPYTERRETSYLLYSICCLPIILSILSVISENLESKSSLYMYMQPINYIHLQIMLVFIKSNFYFVLYPTFPAVVVILHCVLCQRVCRLIRLLRTEVESCPLEEFTISKQSNILRQKNVIDDVMVLMQKVLYLPSFLLCTLNFSSCCTAVAWFVLGYQKEDDITLFATFSLFFAIAAANLLAYFWFAGGLPIEMDAFREEFCKKVYHRLLTLGKTGEIVFQKALYETPSFVLSGCDILYFKRSSILGLAGAILTYTLLLVTS
ncbi:uncharacterized protein NPIL_469001 [Nephila pilipes]|uniref:Gustatory receptor n=1 Tax=Nephila pilipes TaxID=299642 RepID=A0A8X6N2M4_NEPPI|nr:uncharacterized protein NPIL_469001 [Nephila pilipes]